MFSISLWKGSQKKNQKQKQNKMVTPLFSRAFFQDDFKYS